MMIRLTTIFLGFIALISSAMSNPATLASISPNLGQWQAVVNAGNPTVTNYATVNGSNPISINVGTFAAGTARSFEVIFNAVGAGPSRTLLGSQVASSGEQFLKLHQWNNIGKFGLTTSGVADYVFSNSPTLSNQHAHAVFVSNGVSTTLYLNGVAQSGIVNESLKITGTYGLGAGLRPDQQSYFDNLDGTISGFASYARALSQAEVTARYDALIAPVAPGTPSLTSISPAFGLPSGNTSVTLTGTNFTGATGVTFGGVAATNVTVVNATTITAMTPARSAGTASVVVTTPNGSNAANSIYSYVTLPNDPVAWLKGEGNALDATALANNGVVSGSVSYVAGRVGNAFSFNGDGNNRVRIPNTASLQTSLLTVEYWIYFNSIQNVTNVTKLSPSGAGNSWQTGITYNGSNFLFQFVGKPAGALADWYSAPLASPVGVWTHVAATYDGATIRGYVNGIQVLTQAVVLQLASGNADIHIGAYPNGTFPLNGQIDELSIYNRALSATEIQSIFLVGPAGKPTVIPAPTVTSISPATGTTLGGTSVTLTGTNFTGATAVTFGGVAATNVTVVNATTITATTPARAAGTASVVVTTPAGSNAANSLYTYVTPIPTVTSISPATGTTSGGTSVTLTGNNFTGATGVTFGGVAATNITVVNATTITATTPASAAGTASVVVATPLGNSALNTLFSYIAPSVVANYSTGNEIPVTSQGYTATGMVNFTLSFAPSPGTQLVVVKNTSLAFINGRFSNLSQGQVVTLSYLGSSYRFVANYYGDSGNDLVLQWADTKLFSWGLNGNGKLGNNSIAHSFVPVAVTSTGSLSGKTVIAFASGQEHSLAACSDGTLLAWGQNTTGELGNGTTTNSTVPVLVNTTGVLSGKTVIAVSAGNGFSLALCSDGTLASWGENQNGQLGNGTINNSLLPVLVNASGVLTNKTIVAISAGQWSSLVLCSDGTLATWGANQFGQLGNLTIAYSVVPTLVTSTGVLAGKTVISISASAHCLALCSDGTLAGWGFGIYGQLGDSTLANASVPILVNPSGALAGKTISAISCGAFHNVALCSDSTVTAWGNGVNGQLGANNTNSQVPLLVTPPGAPSGQTAVAVEGGIINTYVIYSDGTVAAVGALTYSGQAPPGNRFIKLGRIGSAHHTLALAAVAPPVPSSITPSLGSVTGGTSVIIAGTNFNGATSVTFGNTAATSFSVLSDASISAVAPPGAEGPASVIITTPGGANVSNTLFTYMPVPVVTAISPSRGTILGGTSVTINGTALLSPNSVQFGGISGAITSSTPTAITVVTPPRPAGAVNVVVSTSLGISTTVGGFTYEKPQPGEVDPLNVSIVGSILLSTATQPDGRVIMAGNFSQILGASRNHLARLNADDTLDSTFNPNPNGPVTTVAVQPDGKILIGGQFTTLQPNGAASPTARNRLARLNVDGSLDLTFNPNANSTVNCIVPQADGKILVGGIFNAFQPNGAGSPTTRNRLARLLADGTLDLTFNPNPNDEVLSLSLQGNGQILLAGRFTSLQPTGATSATVRNRVARLNVDGSLDAGFDPNSNGLIQTLAVQTDGGVLLGGNFTTLQPNGAGSATARLNLARVQANGALDASFDPQINGAVYSLALQSDGRIITGGLFTSLQPNGAISATPRNRVARLLSDGSLDANFNPNANSNVFSCALQSDGSILIGGSFTTLQPNGSPSPVLRDYFARLANGAATESISTVDSSRVAWMRDGSAPQLSHVTFEFSTNSGTSWAPLSGLVTRVGSTGSWEIIGSDYPVSGHIRARGRVAGGFQSGGSGLVEQVTPYSTVIAVPLAASISTDRGTTLGGTTMVITGTRFVGVTGVTVGGNPVTSFSVISPTSISAVTPAGLPGTAAVIVTTAGGSSLTNSLFTYVTPPSLTGVSPARGTTSGGNTLVISGSGFVNVTSVTIGGNAATSFVVDSPTQITAVTPTGVAGVSRVFVQVNGASSAINSLYTYVTPPAVTGVNPSSGSTAGGQSISITGTDLSNVTGVTIGGVAATNLTINSATNITVTTPATTPGPKSVIVTSPGGVNGPNTLFTSIAPTTTTLVSSQNPSVFLTPPIFTARAISDQSGINGQMALYIDDVLLQSKAIDASGFATFSPSSDLLVSGTRGLRAVFNEGSAVANFASSSGLLSQTVNKSTLNIALGQLNYVFDGTGKNLSPTTNAPSGSSVTVSVTYNGSTSPPTQAGNYSVSASVVHPQFQGSASGTMVIAKASLSFSASPTPLVYNNTPRAPSLAFTPSGVAVSVTYRTIFNGSPTGLATAMAPTLPGRYLATLATSSPNHELTATTLEFTIEKARATTIFYATNQVFDGTPRIPTIASEPAGIPITLSYQSLINTVPTGVIASQAPLAVGSYLVTASSPNHDLVPATTILNISKRPVSISLQGLSPSFDGQPKPVTATTNPPEIPLTVTYSSGAVTTTTAPSSPPQGGTTWQVNAAPTDLSSNTGSATGLLKIDPRRPSFVSLTGPAVTIYGGSGNFIATVTRGSGGVNPPTGNVTYRIVNYGNIANGTVGVDGKATWNIANNYLPTRTAPYEMIAEYGGDSNYLPSSSNTLITKREKNTILFYEYAAYLDYTGRPAVISSNRLAFLVTNPSFVSSYTITHNGSTVLPTNVTTTPARIEIDYTTPYSNNYRDIINLNISQSSARLRVGNLQQNFISGQGHPVSVTTDPPGLATRITYNGTHLPNGPTAPGSYTVASTFVDSNFTVYNQVEASGTLVIRQNIAVFSVTNLSHNYDGFGKSVSVSANPPIPYTVTYNGQSTPPMAPGRYNVKVTPQDTASYGSGSSHTLVINARISATVNGAPNQTNLRITNHLGNTLSSFPAFISPNQNEWKIEFINNDILKFKSWADGSKENPRNLVFGESTNPASYSFNALASSKIYLEAQTVATGLPSGAGGGAIGKGFYEVGEVATFEAATFGDAIINRWEYAGKVLSSTDGHTILRDGREVRIKVVAGGGNPICHFTAGYIAEGFGNGIGSGGTVEVTRKDYPSFPVLAQRFMPNGVNYVAQAKPATGFVFQGWGNMDSARFLNTYSPFGGATPTNREEFVRVGTKRYSSVFPRFIKDGPELDVSFSQHKRKVSYSPSGVDLVGLRTISVRVTNNGSATSQASITRFRAVGYRIKTAGSASWTYFYPYDRNQEEIDANRLKPMTASQRGLMTLSQPVAVNSGFLNFWNLNYFGDLVTDASNPKVIDYPLSNVSYKGVSSFEMLLGGSGQNVNFGWEAQAEVRIALTIQTSHGLQYVDAWWIDINPSD